MAKHKGRPERDAVALSNNTVALLVDAADMPLFEKLLMHYANEIYLGRRPDSFRWRGYSMHHTEARDLANKIRQLRRG